MHEDDGILTRRAAGGDDCAFRELVERHAGRVYAAARRVTGDDEDARDVAQEVFIRLHGALKGFDATRRFTTWLYRMTVNLAIDHRRRRGVIRTTPLDDEAGPSAVDRTPGPDDEHESRAFRDEITAIAQGLTDRQRTAFVLRDLEECTTAEVAAIMGCRESTVRVHLAAAREYIRDVLMRRYPDRFGGRNHESTGRQS